MKENRKNPTGLLIGGVITALAAIVAFIARVAAGSELDSVKNSYAMIVQVGSEQMSRTEYLEYASGLVSTCTVAAVVLVVLTAVLFVFYFQKRSR